MTTSGDESSEPYHDERRFTEAMSRVRVINHCADRVGDGLTVLAAEVEALAGQVLRCPLPGIDRPLRPAISRPEDLREAAEELRAVARVALAHGAAWQVFTGELVEWRNEAINAEQMPWARGSGDGTNG
jgi:hypothetical protein